MPEGVDPLAQRFKSAVSVVESCWQQAGLRPLRLDARQLASYGGRFPIGWRFDCDFSDRRRRLDVLVTAAFPFAPARIALVDRPSFLTWPHVERDGVLCLVPDHATFPIDDPYAGIAELLEMTFDLIEALIRGERNGDFRSEFLTYWHHAGSGRARTILSLIKPAPPSRIVRIWKAHEELSSPTMTTRCAIGFAISLRQSPQPSSASIAACWSGWTSSCCRPNIPPRRRTSTISPPAPASPAISTNLPARCINS
ncbi:MULTISPECIES: E2/UBC family protein [unclassified Mesorhizobium]|uniref:E2/UBC family protein n=1 Tax=unclassified Mesorhizobium TaxID=325217 RepID=UPI00333D89BF